MAQITKSIAANRNQYLVALLIPERIRKSIPQSELDDRIAHAQELSARIADRATSPTLRTAYKLRADAVLNAQPREVTERQHKELITKAAAVTSRGQAEAIRQQAERLINEDHPPAPRRWSPVAVIAKAKADGHLMACFDEQGKLYGVCDPDDIQPIEGHSGTSSTPAARAPGGVPQQAAGVAAVAKASKAAGKQMRAVFDQQGRLVGIIDPDDVILVLASPAEPEAVAKARAAQRAPGIRIRG